MKKTNFFLLFAIAFITGISLPNELFASLTVGFIFSTVLITIGLIMYTIALYNKTQNLMSVDTGDGVRIVHLVRGEAVIILLVMAIYFINLSCDSDKENLEAKATDGYWFSFYVTLWLLISTVLGIYLSNDLERKKAEKAGK